MPKSDIYDQHRQAFKNVSAYVIVKDGKRVASIAFKFPADGVGRLWAYVHFFAVPMVRGQAKGYGYDKASAAVENAVRMINAPDHVDNNFVPFIANLSRINGASWDSVLRDAGFDVFGAV